MPTASELLAEMDAIHAGDGWTAPLSATLAGVTGAQAEWEPPAGHAIIAIVRHMAGCCSLRSTGTTRTTPGR